MTYTIRPSVGVEFTKAPAVAIAGPSGSGKTESAMRLARGFCGPTEKFVIIDTEEKRALYKKDRYQPWDWLDFQPPFTPENCRDVLELCKGYKAVIWDSGSHEYAGEGGISDIAEDTLEKLAKGDPQRMEALVGPSWKEAKKRHKRVLMSYLIRYPTLLIICLRAEPKVKFIKVEKNGRMVNSIVDAGTVPICEKMFMYEMLVGCKMTAENAGVPEHIKKLEPDLEPVFLAGQQIDEATGQRLAAWASVRADKGTQGADAQASGQTSQGRTVNALPGSASDGRRSDQKGVTLPVGEKPAYLSVDQVIFLNDKCRDNGISSDALCKAAKVRGLGFILAENYERANQWLDKAIESRTTKERQA